MNTQNIIAWSVAALLFLLYLRNVAKCHRRRKEAEFWKRIAQYAGIGAGIGCLGWYTHRQANHALGMEDGFLRETIARKDAVIDELRAENADLRKQLNMPEND